MIALVASVVLGLSSTSLLDGLEQLDRQLVGAEMKLQELEAERKKLLVEVASLTAERAALQVREQQAFDDYRRRVRALARLPAGARAIVLGGARSLAEILETQRILRWVAQNDRALYERYVRERDRAELARAKVADREARLARTVADSRAERDRLAAVRAERVALVATTMASAEAAGRAAEEQRLARSAVGGLLRKLAPAGRLSESFAANRGKLPWPAAGPLGAGFGTTVDPRFATTVAHPGIDVLARAGTPVQAVAAGTVVYAGWLRGFGQLVIVDHGDDFHTLSAHLAELRVRVGDPVVAGTIIGTVGDTGSLTGPHLYFEIRRGGVAEDPRPWLRR